ncbi:MAG: site-specific DNA-methyltransferase [Vulcanimicrobiaceae bacterium]
MTDKLRTSRDLDTPKTSRRSNKSRSEQVELLQSRPSSFPNNLIWSGDVSQFLTSIPNSARFDLVVSSPPYNIGKPYERKSDLAKYREWQTAVLHDIVARLSSTGSLCWQVGNYVDNNEILPLDILFHPIMKDLGLRLRNRIIWTFGHGLHAKRRFSGRYEVVLWYTKSDDYYFDLDSVRVPAKYPGKRSFRGPKRGKLSGNPLGKNPEDVWVQSLQEVDDVWRNIPNVKSNHPEKTAHPCQFPVGLIERLVLALTKPGDLVFDPFAGVGSAGVASLIHGRRFWGCEVDASYASVAHTRLHDAINGRATFRPHSVPLYDSSKSRLALIPAEWEPRH